MQLNPLANLSVQQLKQAIAIREEIEKLETELGRMLTDTWKESLGRHCRLCARR